MLKYKYGYSATRITNVIIVAHVGGVCGGTIVGYLSQIFGRRLSIIAMCLFAGAALYPYTNVSGPGLYPAAFFFQFFVQGAWGVVPIHLIELSPTAFRTFVVGTSYQLGNLVASPSNTIATTLGEKHPLADVVENGKVVKQYDYSIPMLIFMACILTYLVFVTFLGPEELGRGMNDDDDIVASNEEEVAGSETKSGNWA
jgi:SHS family lactate transporter-like MFS transporter